MNRPTVTIALVLSWLGACACAVNPSHAADPETAPGPNSPGAAAPAEAALATDGSSTRAEEARQRRTSYDQPFLDANGNGVEDTIDIITGSSLDEDGNGIPDDAEARMEAQVADQRRAEPRTAPARARAKEPFLDHNMNGVDDMLDILYGTSLDENQNGIPDDGEFTGPVPAHLQGKDTASPRGDR